MTPSAFSDTHNETDDKYYKKDKKQDSGNFSGAYSDPAESKYSGYDGDYEKHGSVVKHG
jgi:hypothetical protein